MFCLNGGLLNVLEVLLALPVGLSSRCTSWPAMRMIESRLLKSCAMPADSVREPSSSHCGGAAIGLT